MPNSEFNFSMYNTEDVVFLCCALFCVCCAALAAGMTIGLLSLDTLKLKIKLSVGTPEEKKAAKIILPILKNHHYLLCTLLLFNAGANEALPIFLDAIVPAWCAVILSVTLVLICGEVIPTAIFSGPHQLSMASKFTPVIYCLEFILSPIAYPMSLALDYLLGVEEEDDTFNRDEMAAMVNIIRDERTKSAKSLSAARESTVLVDEEQGWCDLISCFCCPKCCGTSNEEEIEENRQGNATSDSLLDRKLNALGASSQTAMNGGSRKSGGNPASTSSYGEFGGSSPRGGHAIDSIAEDEEELSNAEINVISGVLGLAKLKVRDICIPLSDVNMLSSDQVLNMQVIDAIDKVGHTRLPVFRGSNINDIIGFFIVKRLMVVNPETNTPLSAFPLNAPIVVGANVSVLDAMKTFQQSTTHLALVSEEPNSLRASIAAGLPPKPSAAPLGILTIEDIFEAMLQEDIEDETDQMVGDSRASAASTLRDLSMSMSSSLTTSKAPGVSAMSMLFTASAGSAISQPAVRTDSIGDVMVPKSILKKTPSFHTLTSLNVPSGAPLANATSVGDSASVGSETESVSVTNANVPRTIDVISTGSDSGTSDHALIPGIPSHLLLTSSGSKKKRPSWKHESGSTGSAAVVGGFRANSYTPGGGVMAMDEYIDEVEADSGEVINTLHAPLLGSSSQSNPTAPRPRSHSHSHTKVGLSSGMFGSTSSVNHVNSVQPAQRALSSAGPRNPHVNLAGSTGNAQAQDLATTNALLRTKGLTGSMLARHLGVKVRSSGSFSHQPPQYLGDDKPGERKRLKSMHA